MENQECKSEIIGTLSNAVTVVTNAGGAGAGCSRISARLVGSGVTEHHALSFTCVTKR